MAAIKYPAGVFISLFMRTTGATVLLNVLLVALLTKSGDARDGILDLKCDSQTADFCGILKRKLI
jgi:hypothetical protein